MIDLQAADDYYEEHGLVALLSHLGLDGSARLVNELYDVAQAAHQAANHLASDESEPLEHLRDTLAQLNDGARPSDIIR